MTHLQWLRSLTKKTPINQTVSLDKEMYIEREEETIQILSWKL